MTAQLIRRRPFAVALVLCLLSAERATAQEPRPDKAPSAAGAKPIAELALDWTIVQRWGTVRFVTVYGDTGKVQNRQELLQRVELKGDELRVAYTHEGEPATKFETKGTKAHSFVLKRAK